MSSTSSTSVYARRPPSAPGAVPLLGHIPLLRKLGFLPALERFHAELGDVFELRLGPKSLIVVVRPEAIERIFVSNTRNYDKQRAYAPIREFLGDGLVTLVGEHWRERRRLLQPHFHRARLEAMVEGMVAIVDAYLEGLRGRLPDGGVIDMHREMVALTLDIMVNALFGPGLARGRDASYELLTDSVLVMNQRVQGLPVPLWIPTASNRRFKRTLARLDAAVFAIIDAARRQREADPTQLPTLLGMLLDSIDDETDEPLSDRAIRDEVMTFYVAGHETTALMMTWLFALTGGRTDVWGAIEDELHHTLNGRIPRFAELASLVYLRQVIDETLRMRPATPALSRDVIADDELIGYQVEAGEFVLPYIFGLHHHRELWDQPRRFDPSRFAAGAEREKWSYIPFAAGPRMCIGNNFALAEGALILAMLLQRAEWALEPGPHIEPLATGTLRPSAPVNVRVRWK